MKPNKICFPAINKSPTNAVYLLQGGHEIMIIDSRNTAIVFDDHKLFSDSFSALIERLGLFHSVHTLSDTRELTNFLSRLFEGAHILVFGLLPRGAEFITVN